MNQKLAPLRKSITLKKKKTEVLLISKIDSSIFFFFFGEAGSNQSFRKWSNCIISLFCQFKFLFTNGFNERYNCWLLHTYQYLAKMSKHYLLHFLYMYTKIWCIFQCIFLRKNACIWEKMHEFQKFNHVLHRKMP